MVLNLITEKKMLTLPHFGFVFFNNKGIIGTAKGDLHTITLSL
jgi:hypothetical protein